MELPFYPLLAFEQNSILKLEFSAEMAQIGQLRERQQGEKKNQRSHLDYSSEFSSINQGCKVSARWKWRVNPQGKTSREIWFWLKSLHIKQFQSFRTELWNRTLSFLAQTIFCSFSTFFSSMFSTKWLYIVFKIVLQGTTEVKPCSAIKKKKSTLCCCFQHKSKTLAPYWPLWRKLSLPSQNQHRV